MDQQVYDDIDAIANLVWVDVGGTEAAVMTQSRELYVSDGVWILPCGEMYEDPGNGNCGKCDLCERIESLFA